MKLPNILKPLTNQKKEFMKSHQSLFVLGLFLMIEIFMPDLAHAGLESSLMGIKMKLTGVIMPLLSVIGIAFAAISFFTGNPQAKQHILYAVLGCMFGFGAQAIVDFISQTVR